MFLRSSAILLSVAVLARVATAGPNALQARWSPGECNTGNIQCCTETYNTSATSIIDLFSTLELELTGLTDLVGFGCSPITGTGTGSGSTCTEQPVCCTGDEFDGLINVGCSPITINA